MGLLPQRTEIETIRTIGTTESSMPGAKNVLGTVTGQRGNIIHARSVPAVATEINRQLDTGTAMCTTGVTTTTKEAERNGRGRGNMTGDTRPHTVLQVTIIKSQAGTAHAMTVVTGGPTMASRAAIEQNPNRHVPSAPHPGVAPDNAVYQVKTAHRKSAG